MCKIPFCENLAHEILTNLLKFYKIACIKKRGIKGFTRVRTRIKKKFYALPQVEFDFYLHIICGQLCACVGRAQSEKIGKFMSGIFASYATHFSLKVNMHS